MNSLQRPFIFFLVLITMSGREWMNEKFLCITWRELWMDFLSHQPVVLIIAVKWHRLDLSACMDSTPTENYSISNSNSLLHGFHSLSFFSPLPCSLRPQLSPAKSEKKEGPSLFVGKRARAFQIRAFVSFTVLEWKIRIEYVMKRMDVHRQTAVQKHCEQKEKCAKKRHILYLSDWDE